MIKTGDRLEAIRKERWSVGNGEEETWDVGQTVVAEVSYAGLVSLRNLHTGSTARMFCSTKHFDGFYGGHFRPVPPPAEVDPVPVGSRWKCNHGGPFPMLILGTYLSDGRRVRWEGLHDDHAGGDKEGTISVLYIIGYYTRLPDEPAPEAGDGSCRRCRVPFCGCPPEAKPARKSLLDTMLENAGKLKPQSSPPTPAVCGRPSTIFPEWTCREPHGHTGAHDYTPYRSQPQSSPPQPAAYQCAPGCSPAAPCGFIVRDKEGMIVSVQSGCRAAEHLQNEQGVSVCMEERGLAPRPPARSYQTHEFSYSGASATLCRMTGRR